MDEVFKAMADPSRRTLLDALFDRDGQTLSALEEQLPMTRFGVMKHLKVLEEANLVTTKRRGREKLHFLNPVPIRLVHDRWVSKYAEPWAAALSDLKKDIETKENVMEKVFEVYIKTTPERLWEAITDGTTMKVLVGPDYDGEVPAAKSELREGANDELYGGWTMILSGLKTFLETGEYIDTPATLRFAAMSGGQAA